MDIGLIIILVVVGLILWQILKRVFANKCPKCQQYRAVEYEGHKITSEKEPFFKTLTREDIHKNSEGKETGRTERTEQVRMIRYSTRNYYHCNKCGYKFCKDKIVEEEG